MVWPSTLRITTHTPPLYSTAAAVPPPPPTATLSTQPRFHNLFHQRTFLCTFQRSPQEQAHIHQTQMTTRLSNSLTSQTSGEEGFESVYGGRRNSSDLGGEG
mmetsp:Transcript_12172/g.17342  ORF Transcript_12172/g.17342 Transcript_12172/m.17342 type:complete len:102 (-) Transcript_12172:264-569(-)